MIDPKNIIIHELIGLEMVVLNHSDPSLIGKRGTVVDETLNLLVVATPFGEKKIPKKYGVFAFRINTKWTIVRGDEILFRPWERPKRGYKKYLRRKPLVFDRLEEAMVFVGLTAWNPPNL